MRRGRWILAGLFWVTSVPAWAATLPEKLPADTLIYLQWPGATVVRDAHKDTAMAKLMAEPQMAALREKLIPTIDVFIRTQAENEGDTELAMYNAVAGIVEMLWQYPTAIALVGVDGSSVIPMVDAAAIVEAGDDAEKLAAQVTALLEQAELPMQTVREVEIGKAKMKELSFMGPAMALRWGVVNGDFVIAFGTKAIKHLEPDFFKGAKQDKAATQPTDGVESADATKAVDTDAGKSLLDSASFAKAMSVTGGSEKTPLIYVNLAGAIRTLESFQPTFSGFGLPVLGEEGGVRKALDSLGLAELQSFTVVTLPEAGGMKTVSFVHCPGMKRADTPPPLTEADLAVIPQDATWAKAGQFDLAGFWAGIRNVIQLVSPETNTAVQEFLDDADQRLGYSIEKDLLGGFGDTWVVFDSASSGSLLFTGVTLVVDTKTDHDLDKMFRSIVQVIAEESRSEITVREEKYRGHKIAYTNYVGIPMPLSPAWAQVDGRLIICLYPQMVRLTIDHMLDKGPSIFDNADFRRGYALMPRNADMVAYMDTARGIRMIYSIALPVSQALLSMGQDEGFDMDVSILPALPAISQHILGNVVAGAMNEDGYVWVSHGAIPSVVAAYGGEATVTVPVMVSVLLPSLARERELSKRAVCAANLAGVARASLVYAEERKGKLPPDLETLVNSGAITWKMLICPSSNDQPEEGVSSYEYIGGGLRNVDDPRLVIAYEKPGNHGNEGMNVAYLDGHVQFRMDVDQVMEDVEKSKELVKDREGDDESKVEPGAKEKTPTDEDDLKAAQEAEESGQGREK